MVRDRLCAILTAGSVILGCVASGQVGEGSLVSLILSGETEVAGSRPSSVWLPVVCDGQGNVYARLGNDPSRAPSTRKISPTGKETATFSIDRALGDTKHAWDAAAYILSPSGRFYLLGARSGSVDSRVAILGLDAQGRLESNFRVNARRFVPLKLGAFSDDLFLISGVIRANARGTPYQPFTGIVDRSGKVRLVRLEGDVSPSAGALERSRPDRPPDDDQASQAVQAIALGAVALSEDGTMYLSRRTPNLLVYEIRRDGHVMRRMQLPSPWVGFLPTAMTLAGDRVLVYLEAEPGGPGRADPAHRLALYDRGSGELLRAFEVPRQAGTMACGTRAGVTFLGPDRYNMRMVLQRGTFPPD